MDSSSGAPPAVRTDLYHGLFRHHRDPAGGQSLSRHEAGPADIPCPNTGRPLRVATLDAGSAAICPRCSREGHGGFVSFVGDLRMAYACPLCQELVWLSGA